MTVLQKEAGSGIGKKSYGLGSYLIVAVVAVAVGVGAAVGFQSVTNSGDTALIDSRIEAGLVRAQQSKRLHSWPPEVRPDSPSKPQSSSSSCCRAGSSLDLSRARP